MAATFYPYHKNSFLPRLRDVVKHCGLRFLDIEEVSSSLATTMDIKELVFSLPTRQPGARVLVYSSIDAATGRMRAKDSDRVRLVLRVQRGDEPPLHFHIGQCNRVENLFENLQPKYKDALDRVWGGTAEKTFKRIDRLDDED